MSDKSTPSPETPEETRARLSGAQATPKGRPTPTRREREAANLRPLVSNSRAEAKQKQREYRQKAQAGMASGDERYLTARDKGVDRRYIRDFIDSRLGITEFVLPIMLVVLLGTTLIPTVEAQVYITIALYSFILVVAIDSAVMCMILKRRLEKKFGANAPKKFRFYAVMRYAQIRPLRLPKPQVKVGATID